MHAPFPPRSNDAQEWASMMLVLADRDRPAYLKILNDVRRRIANNRRKLRVEPAPKRASRAKATVRS